GLQIGRSFSGVIIMSNVFERAEFGSSREPDTDSSSLLSETTASKTNADYFAMMNATRDSSANATRTQIDEIPGIPELIDPRKNLGSEYPPPTTLPTGDKYSARVIDSGGGIGFSSHSKGEKVTCPNGDELTVSTGTYDRAFQREFESSKRYTLKT